MHNLVVLALLCAILAVAVYGDVRSHRISNTLSLLGLITGLALQLLGSGLHGLTSGLLGAGVGLACFAPFYLLRAMGAGDVKLLAAVGAFLGPQGALYAALFSLLAGGSAQSVMCCGALCARRSAVLCTRTSPRQVCRQ